jgi:hypothetical protein
MRAKREYEAVRFVDVPKTAPCFEYPVAERIMTEKGSVFYDS